MFLRRVTFQRMGEKSNNFCAREKISYLGARYMDFSLTIFPPGGEKGRTGINRTERIPGEDLTGKLKTIAAALTLALLWGGIPCSRADGPRNPEGQKRPGIVMITWRGETRAEIGFMDGLSDCGYAPRLVKRHCDQDPDRLNLHIREVEKDLPDLIYVFGTTATKGVVSRIHSCPVIYNIVTRPVASGIIADWQSSGNNATGVSSMVPIRHQIRTLEKVAAFSRLGVIYNPLEQNSLIQIEILETLTRSLDIQLVLYPIRGRAEVAPVLENLREQVDAVYLPSDSMVKSLGNEIMVRINGANLPSLAALEEMVINDGALIGLVPDYYRLGRMAARKANKILTGHPPSEVPSATSDHFNITVNLKTAKEIGVHIPTAILVMADKIIR